MQNMMKINSDSFIKVCHFSLDRCKNKCNGKDVIMTHYVATRWYRVPEILLESTIIGVEADICSIECIKRKLLGGKPMNPDTSTLSQINVLEVTRKPNKVDIQSINSELA